ncbi:MAG: DNA mismatch repair protein MutS [Lachnospiraceae bacterium]|nr:DNA mismatch repair protein MutS [Lachnospiraceae bacterium]
MAKLTPMMEQYFNIKNQNKDSILFFRLGDFYEMFYDDAIVASKELDIALTGKDCGQEERAPMCGVPFHSVDGYISKLVAKGYKVAICEQVEDPKLAKGIVKREIIRVITPGTVIDNIALDERKNNYIMCIYANKNGYGVSACDVSTGEFETTELKSYNANSSLIDEISKFSPAELISNEEFFKNPLAEEIKNRFRINISTLDQRYFNFINVSKKLCEHFKVHNLHGFGLKDMNFAITACGALMEYLLETQKNGLMHISRIKPYSVLDYMFIDSSSRRNLELTETMREKSKTGTLLWVIDKTITAMGARLMRKWAERPLIDCNMINKRLMSVAELKSEIFIREEIKEILRQMYDYERILSKIIYQTANGRDLVSLKNSIENLPLLKTTIKKCKSDYIKEIYDSFDTLEDIFNTINKGIVDEPPFTIREGGIIKLGFNSELDVLFKAKTEGKTWIEKLEEEEKEKTGIKNLKIRYNKVFGYYIEITKSNIKDVPERYIRKQTLANCERYTTEELNSLAELILSSEEKMVSLEYDIFCEIRNQIALKVERIQLSAYLISVLDCLQSLAQVAESQNFVQPVVSDSDKIEIKDGRHPVVEKSIKGDFIPNDVSLDCEDNRLLIITGPNMAGKSTYMRQVALIVLMAQMGSFVPASYAHIGVVDRIFTRVGASDDLSSGQSTFMVEMTEVANILNNATKNSLLILDEIGRGTSTFDGLSIAWSVLEYIADEKLIGAKTLFATHYHELTELEGKLSGVKNYCIAIKESGEDIIFLRKIKRGGADHSYGIQVARLAGLPGKVIKRSSQILKQLNAADIAKKAKKIAIDSKEEVEKTSVQMDIFTIKENQILEELNKIDVLSLTPIEAIQTLFELQKKSRGL